MHLIAASLGGLVAVRVAAQRPDLIRTLTLISPALPDRRPRADLIRFPVLTVPRLADRLLAKFRTLSPEQGGVWNTIVSCFCDPGVFARGAGSPSRWPSWIRSDALDYPDKALIGAVRTILTEHVRGAGALAALAAGRSRSPPRR